MSNAHCEEGQPISVARFFFFFFLAELEHIEQDERVYMSQKGDLYFANVEEKDSRNDYCCFAAFPKLRTIVQKMPMKLTVNSCKSWIIYSSFTCAECKYVHDFTLLSEDI